MNSLSYIKKHRRYDRQFSLLNVSFCISQKKKKSISFCIIVDETKNHQLGHLSNLEGF